MDGGRRGGRTYDERPFLVLGTMADPRWLDPAIGHEDKQLHRIEDANLYYLGQDQREKVREADVVCTGRLAAHGLSPVPA